MPALINTVFLVRNSEPAARHAFRTMVGGGTVTHVLTEDPGAFLEHAENELLPSIREEALRGHPFYVPLLTAAAVQAADAAQLRAWLGPAKVYLRDSTEDRGILILMDLSHTDYLHPDTLGGGSITRTKAAVADGEDGRVDVAWHSWNEVPIPLLAKRLPAGARVDAWTELSWSAPGVISLLNGAVTTGTPREGAPNSRNVHIFTPKSDAMTHYFFGATRDYNLANAELNEQTRKLRYEIFATEDEPMIRAQQERMNGSDFWAHKPVLLAIDKGAVRVRRKLEALIARERNAFRNEVQEEELVR